MGKLNDLSGKKFNRLQVIKFIHVNSFKKRVYKCICDCGITIDVIGQHLKNGNTKSCGCIVHEGTFKKTHGQTGTRIYRIWANIKSRCTNSKTPQYKNYGGRGIYVQKSWLVFENFYNDNIKKYNIAYKKYGQNTQIDRIDNDGPYSKDNTRWVTRIKNSNNRSSHRYFILHDKKYTLTELARKYNINSETLASRISRGIPIKKAISIPLFSRKLLNLVRTSK